MPVRNSRGTAMVEFALILPVLLMLAFAVVEFGLLIEARLIVTNVAREGGDLASRFDTTTTTENDLITMLQSSAAPLDLSGSGKICITNIVAGSSAASTAPSISTSTPQLCSGSLAAASSTISSGAQYLGLTQAMYNHLVFNTANNAPDIKGVTVVEVFYSYTPITPLSALIPGVLGTGTVLSSEAVFCTVQN